MCPSMHICNAMLQTKQFFVNVRLLEDNNRLRSACYIVYIMPLSTGGLREEQ